jgi:hypothetical protein
MGATCSGRTQCGTAVVANRTSFHGEFLQKVALPYLVLETGGQAGACVAG